MNPFRFLATVIASVLGREVSGEFISTTDISHSCNIVFPLNEILDISLKKKMNLTTMNVRAIIYLHSPMFR